MSYKNLKEQAVTNKSVQNLTPVFVSWEKPGQSVLGKFLSHAAVTSGLGVGEYNQYLFDTDTGLVKFSLGAAADKEYVRLLVSGNIYEVIYKGKEKITKGRSVNKFELHLIASASELAPEDAEKGAF